MLTVNVATQPIKIEYAIQRPVLKLKSTRPQIQIDTEAATLDIRQPQGKLEIDATPCRYARGIKNLADFSRDNAQEGRSTAIETIGRIAEEGNRLASIESGENAVVNMAAETNTSPLSELVLAHVPSPDIRYTPNAPQVNFTPGKVDLTLHRGTIQGEVTPDTFEIQVAQYPSIKMWTAENKVDMMA